MFLPHLYHNIWYWYWLQVPDNGWKMLIVNFGPANSKVSSIPTAVKSKCNLNYSVHCVCYQNIFVWKAL